MEFGLIMMFRNPPQWRRPFQAVYRDFLDLCVVAEELGYDHLWTSEHHFLEDGWSPAQLPILAVVAARSWPFVAVLIGVDAWMYAHQDGLDTC